MVRPIRANAAAQYVVGFLLKDRRSGAQARALA
jgi:hypothetical protein